MHDNDDLAFIEAMERAVGSGDEQTALTYLHEDVAYTVGARPTLRGVAAVIAYTRDQAALARWEGHTFIGGWRSGDVLVVEVMSHFTRIADGASISFPCTDIYRFRDGRIADWRVYADMSPFHQTR